MAGTKPKVLLLGQIDQYVGPATPLVQFRQ